MKTNIKSIVVTATFMALLLGFMIVNIIAPDKDISTSERRPLKQLPELTWSNIISGDFFSDFEAYALDQFVLRDDLRTINTLSKLYLFRQLDSNDIYIVDGRIYKMNAKLNENSVKNAGALYKKLADSIFSEANVYYTIVPDKNFFVADQNGYLSLDYEKLFLLMKEAVGDELSYIDISGILEIIDYYSTDLHWDQKQIIDVANKILAAMGGEAISADDFTAHELKPFYGSYYGQSALHLKADILTYLTNDVIEGCRVFDYESGTYKAVYSLDKFGGTDSYDVFLDGARALLTVENPANTSGRELFIVRDSFGSSIAPLLISNYSKITIIDLRYVKHSALPVLMEHYGIDVPMGADVLFMYNTEMLNQSAGFVQ